MSDLVMPSKGSIRMGALINKNTFEGGTYLKGGAYWKKGAKSNHYSKECP